MIEKYAYIYAIILLSLLRCHVQPKVDATREPQVVHNFLQHGTLF